jgi:hypothetical protein
LAQVNGEWTLTDDQLLAFGRKLRDEDLFRVVFYDGRVKTPEDFVAYFHRPENVAVFLYLGTEPVAFGWLNGFRECSAFAHFCGFTNARGRMGYLGRLGLAYWFTAFEFLNVLLGFISSENRLALRYVRQLGFKEVGAVPEMIHDAYRGEPVPGVLFYFTR